MLRKYIAPRMEVIALGLEDILVANSINVDVYDEEYLPSDAI